MATCYRHSNRETGVSCSNCGRPICPDCMTPTSVGMRCPVCSKRAHEGAYRGDDERRAARDGGDHRHLRRLLPGLGRRHRPEQHRIRMDLPALRALRPARRPRRLLAPGHQRLPAQRDLPHRVQHVPAVDPRPAARAAAGLRAVRHAVLHSAAVGLVRRAGADDRVGRRRRLGRGLRPDGRARGRAVAPRLRGLRRRSRRSDPHQPGRSASSPGSTSPSAATSVG